MMARWSYPRVDGLRSSANGRQATDVPLCRQEATRSALRELTNADSVTAPRGHGHCIAKGADIKPMMAELFGRVDGYCKGKGGSMHIADFSIGMLGANGIVGGGLPIATGAALAAQLEGKGNVAVCFFGDGAVSEGEFHEALNISSVWALPIVFVCENNQYAANNAYQVQHRATELASHAAPYGMPGISIDGNDVLAVYEPCARQPIRARGGRRTIAHRMQDLSLVLHAMRTAPPPKHWPSAEIAEWISRDGIARFTSTYARAGCSGSELEN